MSAVYPNLVSEMAKKGTKKKAVASALGISQRTLYNKMAGAVPFTWPEVQTIHSVFFPSVSLDVLFARAPDTRDSA